MNMPSSLHAELDDPKSAQTEEAMDELEPLLDDDDDDDDYENTSMPDAYSASESFSVKTSDSNDITADVLDDPLLGGGTPAEVDLEELEDYEQEYSAEHKDQAFDLEGTTPVLDSDTMNQMHNEKVDESSIEAFAPKLEPNSTQEVGEKNDADYRGDLQEADVASELNPVATAKCEQELRPISVLGSSTEESALANLGDSDVNAVVHNPETPLPGYEVELSAGDYPGEDHSSSSRDVERGHNLEHMGTPSSIQPESLEVQPAVEHHRDAAGSVDLSEDAPENDIGEQTVRTELIPKKPVLLQHSNFRFSLFPLYDVAGPEVEHLAVLFKNGIQPDVTFEEFFISLREGLKDEGFEFGMDLELVLQFRQLRLSLGEDNVSTKEVTVFDVLHLFETLCENTPAEMVPLYLEITAHSVQRFVTSFNLISELTREGRGLEYLAENESSNEDGSNLELEDIAANASSNADDSDPEFESFKFEGEEDEGDTGAFGSDAEPLEQDAEKVDNESRTMFHDLQENDESHEQQYAEDGDDLDVLSEDGAPESQHADIRLDSSILSIAGESNDMVTLNEAPSSNDRVVQLETNLRIRQEDKPTPESDEKTADNHEQRNGTPTDETVGSKREADDTMTDERIEPEHKRVKARN